MGWGSIYKRRVKVFTVALIIYLDYKALQKREKWFSKPKRSALWEMAHERNAKRVLNLIIELEGLWVKLGQYLSTRADVLPEPYITLLKQLQDSLPPRPLQEVCHTIEKELGKSTSDLFSRFVETPLATASIAQVHRACLKDGKEVVVKVQHEGIKAIILEDLKNAKAIVDWIAWAEPQYNFNPMIDEWCKEAPKELDFNLEAENTRTVFENLGCKRGHNFPISSNHVDVLIPEVIQSTEKVLILEYMDGVRLNDYDALEALGVDKQNLVETITRAYAHQIYVDGFFNGDPHPGNFLVSKEPPFRPVLLDFGLTKLISNSMKRALAKMFLASAEGDHVALLSAFAEMGLRLRLDIPEQAMEITNIFFRTSTPATEAIENMKSLAKERTEKMKVIQEKMKTEKKKSKTLNPVDAFPGDAVIFTRVLNLLRGLSAMLNVRIAYLDIMRPFAETTLLGTPGIGSEMNRPWIFETPALSDVEVKLRKLLHEFGSNKILGIQVCAYKDGKVVIDTAAGVLGRYDPRPVQHDSLFPMFSATKGVTAGMLHWLVDNGKLKLDESVANIWPEFGTNGKESTKVHHILNHTSGLQHAMGEVMRGDPLVMCDWNESLKRMTMASPETEPGSEQFYHYLSFGWLCGGIVEKASGRSFQEVLEEAFVHPLNIEGEFYIGIPPGVESRLATLTLDTDDLETFAGRIGQANTVSALPVLFNTLNIRRAIIPAANGHFSARALARFYATLVSGGSIPPPHSPREPPLGSHPHIPKFPSQETKIKTKRSSKNKNTAKTNNDKKHSNEDLPSGSINHNNKFYNGNGTSSDGNTKIFKSPSIRDAFMGVGDYEGLVLPNGKFGLGFRRFGSGCFGHSGMGGSTGFCDVKHGFAMAVTLNKMSLGGVTRKVVQLVCSELGVPLPVDFAETGETGPDMQPTIRTY
ncbi:uncharacterized protein LOC18440724 isoform X2 [Amborella trichopoda]|uniref:ABC1 atypical kinase-like domain-containing protein n=1 Tax=Amborella trichopoda TaxID=13333 RepID=W1PXC4_AMBTC|nr:uncharacterized protein LOC18440724 isoform X2 [Amborella trichopoda]ERN12506.1 hypothetical protein AMTR_s00025p00182260 [Amborella trichopoda]|eukprot:XP_006850925.1 uncharacterized protein LOC18440724 isoform X2 [Amborella trichopoda]